MKILYRVVGYIYLILLVGNIHGASICTSITSPGINIYSSNITAFPTDLNDAILCIESSNVIVDLGDNFFTQGNSITGFDGIRIASNLTNITIRNGIIRGLTGKGIVVGEGCSNIRIQNISVIDCDATGIFFNGGATNVIKDSILANSLVTSCTGAAGGVAYGARLVNCENIEVTDCDFNKNDAALVNAGYGLSLETSTKCKLTRCHANDNGGYAQSAGFKLLQCQWTIVKECSAITTKGYGNPAGNLAAGFLLDGSSHTTLLSCIAKNTINSNGVVAGFEADNGTNNIFNLCIAANNIGGGGAAGFSFRGTESKSSIFKCKSRFNDGSTLGTGYGIFLGGPQNCDIWYNQLIGNTGAMGVGLKDTVTNTNNLIAGNVTFGNLTAGFQVTRLVGIFPSIVAMTGDFSTVGTASKYMNIDFRTGPA